MRPTVVALYLPQYHPIKENNEWWEPGFTEWTNVTKAKPLYRGHHQPNLPSEFGFYDLRLSETREAQAELAQAFHVDAFCYYHYWFGNGRRLLERPFEEVLASGKPAHHKFMLCWANQSWAGVWHGLDNRILIEQQYPGPEDHEKHFQSLLRAFQDPRYLKVNGKPVFMVYVPHEMPDRVDFCKRWRRMAKDAGFPDLYLVAQHFNPDWDSEAYGFDAFVLVPSFPKRREWVTWRHPITKIRSKLMRIMGRPTILSYPKLTQHLVPSRASGKAIPCVIPNWDNTPRNGFYGVVLEGATPANFGVAVDRALRLRKTRSREDDLFFIKSWNEWGEGNTLEPSRKWGRQYLEALKRQLEDAE